MVPAVVVGAFREISRKFPSVSDQVGLMSLPQMQIAVRRNRKFFKYPAGLKHKGDKNESPNHRGDVVWKNYGKNTRPYQYGNGSSII